MSSLTAVIAVGLLLGQTPRTWTDTTGEFNVEASLLGADDTNVQLARADGKQIQVPLERLSDKDRKYLTVTKRARETPDFLQTDPRGGFVNRGSAYCAPVSISNSLMWLAQHGYPQLCPGGLENDPVAAQVVMIRTLASRKFMDTNPASGTGAAQVAWGVANYVSSCGYPGRLVYKGWRSMLPQVPRIPLPASYQDLADTLANPKAVVWLNLGYYTVVRQRNTFLRTSGHWVTLVGCGYDRDGNEMPNVIVFNDPAGRTGAERRSEFVRVEPIPGGVLAGKFAGLPFQATGFLRLGEGMTVPRGSDCAIVDGAVLLEMR